MVIPEGKYPSCSLQERFLTLVPGVCSWHSRAWATWSMECAESILKSGLGSQLTHALNSCSQLSTWAHGWWRDEADPGDGPHADLELICRQGGSWTSLPSEHTLDSDRLLDSCKQAHLAGVWDNCAPRMWNILGFYEVCHTSVLCAFGLRMFSTAR